ncbi:Hypothetical protein R9X50_00653700 [Acrodontium crateriforme]|uniref:Rho-GTPase-activating protein 8 n=1 Tax=Acrodontium crateriforme TaxID=150365 RepID=A0AAQ3M926_9PEZI|nr:Hypothetical protein R9X50_00653700 [Acrodontium crateriforme]
MSTFSSSFWSADYAAGLGVLFAKLQQGVQENEQVLTIARMRADAEDLYGQKLADIEPATNRIDGGFQRDDGASVKKAYEGVRTEMGEASRSHRKIASNIRELVVNPFGRWCDQHAARVQTSQDDLQGRVKALDRQAETVRQYRSAYYNKCRRVEDLDEEEKLAFQDPNSAATSSPKAPTQAQTVPSIKVDEEEEPELFEIGDQTYQPEQLKKILTHALDNIKLGEAKVPILGTYQNVSTGAEITEYIQANMSGKTVAYAEKIGQDLIDNGFLRLVGNMGSSFANSSRMNYQWRTKVFQLTGIPEKRPKLLGRASTIASQSSEPDTPVIGDRLNEYLGGWNPLNNSHPNETPAEKLRREAKEADERYKLAVRKLDGLRCSLEEAMIDHLKFMERCELDRLKAIKSVILDFSGAISNVIPSLQSTVDNMMLFQETVQPASDVRYLLENYRTGSFFPKVTIYENYYNQVDEQTFGVDIEARARSDRKRVPLIVTTILTFLDSHYPDLEGDEARRSIWIVDVPLAATHHLRNQIHSSKSISMELLDKYEIPIVASVLKLYLLELPDSLVSSHVYEIVKTIYTSTAKSESESARVQVLQSTLGQLRLANIATLDAVITHFSRLIELTSADDAYVTTLVNIMAPCILRPKQESSLSFTERFNVRLVRDLLAHKDAIFGELKRQSSLSHTPSGNTRATRAISTDESRRKEHMEERHRAIAAAQAQAANGGNRSRQPSPAPRPDGVVVSHRRDRSRGAETRFPVATPQSSNTKVLMSPTSSVTSSHRESLNVPLSPPQMRHHQLAAATSGTPSKTDTPKSNGFFHQPPPADDVNDDGSADASTQPAQRDSNIPKVSASITGPSDFVNAGHMYSSSNDSPILSSSDANTPRNSTSTTATTATSGDRPLPSTPSTNANEGAPIKRDSLTRAGVRTSYTRKPATGTTNSTATSGLQRQSVVMAMQDSTEDKNESKGVQLEDRPVDFD